MNIVVFIKQVPDTDNVKWTQNNNIDRANTDCIINPADKEALEAALILKETTHSRISAITMGPKNAECILREALALGADEAVLLCDSKFAGSDTCATSRVLSKVITEKYPDTDLILFGQSAIDGETSQTGPSSAVRLNMPFITHVREIIVCENNTVTVEQETKTDKITCKVELPAVLCIDNYAIKPRIPRIQGYINAQEAEIKKYNLYDLNMNETETGVKGSPTSVSKVFKHDMQRNCKITDSIDAVFDEIKEILEK